VKSTKHDEATPEQQVELLLSGLAIGALWEPAGHGLTYMKTGDREVELMVQQDNAESAQSRVRLGILMAKTGWQVKEDNVQIAPSENLSPQQQYMKEQMKRQEIAQSTWKCTNPDCGCLLSAFPLEDATWLLVGQDKITDDEGNEHDAEIWAVNITCPVCSTLISMEPLEFAMLAGDDLMMSYRTPKVQLEALDRNTIVRMIDSNPGADNIIITGSFCPFSGALLPPHVRGAVVMWKGIGEEEE
tara:strand:- start:376 stop:1107 length:732 start_codon:yes stop_codon:yes gene_type:complete